MLTSLWTSLPFERICKRTRTWLAHNDLDGRPPWHKRRRLAAIHSTHRPAATNP